MDKVLKYFPEITSKQKEQFAKMEALYKDWNLKINVVSRKDIDELYLRHVLHSLGIAKVMSFEPGAKVLDVGTGGGFPGIPLAVLFPETQFHLVDSIGKKIKVVEEVVAGLELTNVKTTHGRVEEVKAKYDFIVSRAVAQMDTFVRWVNKKTHSNHQHAFANGILYLKGGDLTEELQRYPEAEIIPLNEVFDEEFFDTKSVVYLPLPVTG